MWKTRVLQITLCMKLKDNDALLDRVYRKDYAVKCKNSFLAVIVITVKYTENNQEIHDTIFNNYLTHSSN